MDSFWKIQNFNLIWSYQEMRMASPHLVFLGSFLYYLIKVHFETAFRSVKPSVCAKDQEQNLFLTNSYNGERRNITLRYDHFFSLYRLSQIIYYMYIKPKWMRRNLIFFLNLNWLERTLQINNSIKVLVLPNNSMHWCS